MYIRIRPFHLSCVVILLLIYPLIAPVYGYSSAIPSIIEYHVYGSKELDYTLAEFNGYLVAGDTPSLVNTGDGETIMLDDNVKLIDAVLTGKNLYIAGSRGLSSVILSASTNGFRDGVLLDNAEIYDLSPAGNHVLAIGYSQRIGNTAVELNTNLDIIRSFKIPGEKPVDASAVYYPEMRISIYTMLYSNGSVAVISGNGLGYRVELPRGSSLYVVKAVIDRVNLYIVVGGDRGLYIITYNLLENNIISVKHFTYREIRLLNITDIAVAGKLYIVGVDDRGEGFITWISDPLTSNQSYTSIIHGFKHSRIKVEGHRINLYGSLNMDKPYTQVIEKAEAETAAITAELEPVDIALSPYKFNTRSISSIPGNLVDQSDPCVLSVGFIAEHKLIIHIKEYGLKPLRVFTDHAWALIDDRVKADVSLNNDTAIIEDLSTGRHLLEIYYKVRGLNESILIYSSYIKYSGGVEELYLHRNTPYILAHNIEDATLTLLLVNPSNISWNGYVSILAYTNGSWREVDRIGYRFHEYPSRTNITVHLPHGSGKVLAKVYASVDDVMKPTHVYMLNYTAKPPEKTPAPLKTTTTSPNIATSSTTTATTATTTTTTGKEQVSGGGFNTLLLALVIIAVVVAAVAILVLKKR